MKTWPWAVMLLAAAPALAQKRPTPDYDGRGDEGTSAGEVALWVPRVAAAPLYLTSEYLIRRPVGWLVVTGEREQWPRKIVQVFTTDDMKLGIVPSFYVERGFHPVAGAYVFADDFVVDGNDLRLSTSLGFGHQSLTVTNRFSRGAWRFTSRHHASRRDDYQFFGTGPSSRDEDRQRFGALKLETSGALEARAGRARATFELGYRGVDFRASDYDGDPSADTTSSLFAGGSYHGAFQRLELVLDTRRAAEGGGWASLELELGRHHLRAEATAGLAAGLGRGRLVTVGASAAMVEGIDGQAPITELVSVGGSGPMAGFAAGRLNGGSAVALAARYEWPVAPWLNGSLQAGAGNVFDERWGGFAPELLRFSGAVGLRTSGSPDNAFEVLVALGTATLDDGAGIDSVRLVLGGSTGF